MYRRGWLESAMHKKVINLRGEYMPWLSYPAIDFLKSYLKKDARIFEYGTGYSTLFYATNYNHVTSVENDEGWFQKIEFSAGNYENLSLHYANSKEEFVGAIELSGTKFDLIVVDGSWRNECLLKAPAYLKEDGILIMDDADREEHKEAIESIRSNGFFAIPFTGMSALSYEDHTTMIFLRLYHK